MAFYAEISGYFERAHQFEDNQAVLSLEAIVAEETEGKRLAESFLIVIYYYGFSAVMDRVKSEELAQRQCAWLHEVCECETHETYPYSTYILAVCFYHGLAVEKNITRYIEILRKSVAMNYSPAQAALACRYDLGDGVELNHAKAIDLFRQANENGFALGDFFIGEHYRDGLSVPVDQAEALKYFHKAAEQGCSIAINEIGTCYLNGIGVEANAVEAVKWYLKGAELGHSNAQQALGVCYWSGNGVEVNLTEAMFWIEKSAKQGNVPAKISKATYLLGFADHVLRETDVAFQVLQEVHKVTDMSKDNYARTCSLLGHCYFNGHGCKVDEKTALDLFFDALENGDNIYAMVSFERLIPSVCKLSHTKLLIEFVERGYLPDSYVIKDSILLKNCIQIVAEHGYHLKSCLHTAKLNSTTREIYELDEDMSTSYFSFIEAYEKASLTELDVIRVMLESGADYYSILHFQPLLSLTSYDTRSNDNEKGIIQQDLWFAYLELGLNVVMKTCDDDDDLPVVTEINELQIND